MKKLNAELDKLIKILSKPVGLYFGEHIDDQIIQSFLLDWDEALARLEDRTLQLEADPSDDEALKEIKRTLHTIKGDSAVCGLSEVSKVFHKVEDLLEGYLREGVFPAEMLLRIKDWVEKILTAIASGETQMGMSASADEVSEQSLTDVFSLKILIAEDDFTSRLLLQELLRHYGVVHTAHNGTEAVEAVRIALEADEPYDLICLDIMMPEMDGQEALQKIRSLEEAQGILSTHGAKIAMTTALSDMKNLGSAFGNLCDLYLVKPINKRKLLEELRNIELIA